LGFFSLGGGGGGGAHATKRRKMVQQDFGGGNSEQTYVLAFNQMMPKQCFLADVGTCVQSRGKLIKGMTAEVLSVVTPCSLVVKLHDLTSHKTAVGTCMNVSTIKNSY
jgi:hypothetical protein